ncbi:MAG: B12-binding domain-containing radical SAM protein [Oligoflexia bacterium]|nr:B12-binding domain-containing radical SAM protein [Oligoflexia bacterium]
MKVAFINVSLRPDSKRKQLPVGLGYILTAVKREGIAFDLIDMDINCTPMEELEKILYREKYEVIAMGCIVTGYRYIKKIAEIAKKINECTIIVGNSVATSIPELLLENTLVDIAVIGEGDVTIVELLNKILKREKIDDIKGIVFKSKENGKITYGSKRTLISDLDTIGFPDWHIFDIEKYNNYSLVNSNMTMLEKGNMYPLNAARGCPFSCTFCYHVFKDEKYRKYSEQAVTQEIKRLYYEYNSNYISFWDELTFPNIQSVISLVEKIEELKLPIKWEAVSRGNLFKNNHLDLIHRLRDCGCDNISFSLENAGTEILKAMNKKMNISDFIEQSLVLQKGQVAPLTSVVFGYPQETPQTIKQTLKVCEDCGIYPSVGFLLPLPGTPIYNWAVEEKFIEDEISYLERIGDRQDFHINLTKMPDDEFISLVKEGLEDLANKQGLKLASVFKTTTYQKPKYEVASPT